VPVIQALHAADGGTAGTQPMKILVADGSGALGRRVVPLLKRRSHHVDAPTRRGVAVPVRDLADTAQTVALAE
jgi:uncharacterized protein YbjT (DUF2867 family)